MRHGPLLLFGLLPAAAYLLAYHVTPVQPGWHLDVSLNRVVSHFVPLWTFAVAAILYAPGGSRPHRLPPDADA